MRVHAAAAVLRAISVVNLALQGSAAFSSPISVGGFAAHTHGSHWQRLLQPLRNLRLRGNKELQFPSQQHTNGRCRRMFASSQAGGFLRMSQNAGEEEEDWRIPLDTKAVKVFALSDVHADFRPNLDWLREIQAPQKIEGGHNVLLLAGDLATDLGRLREGFQVVKEKFDEVVFVPGNHEMWVQKSAGESAKDSMEKMDQVFAVCSECNVRTKPLILNVHDGEFPFKIFLLPLLSWYHASWDREPELPPWDGTEVAPPPQYIQRWRQPAGHQLQLSLGYIVEKPFEARWADFRYCKWPTSILKSKEGEWWSESTALAEHFAGLNRGVLEELREQRAPSDVVISLSHFLPRQELLPEKRFLITPDIAKVVGSDFLETQVREAGSGLHVFGHSHLPIDLTLDGTRYLQWCLGMQRKGKDLKSCEIIRKVGPLTVYDTSAGWGPQRSTMWTDYYQTHDRDVTKTDRAPWVRQHAVEQQKRREDRAKMFAEIRRQREEEKREGGAKEGEREEAR